MDEMNASIRSVEGTASQAQQTAVTAATLAERGASAVRETLERSRATRAFAAEAITSIRRLADRVASIESIIGVIDDVANKTRMLSLNASIIAAQAGEHGLGFLVVADEIKQLAVKTSGSTGEITRLIGEALQEGEQVQSFVDKGMHTVDDAVVRSEEADRVLGQIVSGSRQLGELVRSVASAMTEQSRASAQVMGAMQEVQGSATAVRRVVSGQVSEGQELEGSMREMRALMTRSLETVQEQASHAEQAIAAIDSIFDQIRRISELQTDQVQRRNALSRAFQALSTVSQKNTASATDLFDAVESADGETKRLAERVRFFRL
jgi:methyl-accepting chemotaxis protein